MNENHWIEALSVPLPEDVMKHKWHGDFSAAERILERRLAGELPEVMRRRLLLEQKILKRLPGNYPLDRDEACRRLSEAVTDFKPQELDELMDADYADWIYIEGKPHFRDNLIENLFKTRADYRARRRQKPEKESEEKCFLQEAIRQMQKDGGIRRTIRLRSRLWFVPGTAAGPAVQTAEEAAGKSAAGMRPGEIVRVWLPLPGVGAQVKAVRILGNGIENLPEGSVKQLWIAPETAKQRTICWEAAWQPGMEFSVEYEYDIEAGYVDLWSGLETSGPREQAQPRAGLKQTAAEDKRLAAWRARYACLDAVEADDLTEQLPHIVFSPMLCELTKEIVGTEERPLEKARRIYDYVTKKIHYSYMRDYLTLPVIPEYVAAGQKGDCGAQAVLFITMCRIAGIPARWQSGLYVNPGRVGNHDWARFYIEEYGWLFADCSFGGGAYREGDEERRRFYFGNLEPWRMPSCRRFQSDFEPPIKRLRNDPYDAQSGEAELCGERHDVYPYESETRMISYGDGAEGIE